MLALFAVVAVNSYAESQSFNYLEFNGEELISTHSLKYKLNTPEGFNKIQPHDFKDTFHEHPFNISVAAMMGEGRFIMISAEALADKAGILDYSYYPAVKLKGVDFYLRESCLPGLSVEDINARGDITYIHQNGFDLSRPAYLNSYFLNSTDGNEEYILHYGKHVTDCSEQTITDEFKRKLVKEIERDIHLTKISL